MLTMQTRRRFLTSAAVAAAGLARTPRALAAEDAPETTSVTLAKTPALCTAPQFIAEELLHAACAQGRWRQQLRWSESGVASASSASDSLPSSSEALSLAYPKIPRSRSAGSLCSCRRPHNADGGGYAAGIRKVAPTPISSL